MKYSLRAPWLLIAAAFCLAAWGFSPLFGYFTAEARNSTSNAATAAVFEDGDDCEDELFTDLHGPTINGQMPRGMAKYRLGDGGDSSENRLKVFVRFVNLPE